MADQSQTPSGDSTPNQRFAAQSLDAEDVLKGNTVGLVHLSDFRKRRAEALEQTTGESSPAGTGANTPDGREASSKPVFKKKKKSVKKGGGLSFNDDEDEGQQQQQQEEREVTQTPGSNTPATKYVSSAPATDGEDSESTSTPFVKKRLRPNSNAPFHAKALTKAAMAKETQLKEQLKQEFLRTQEAVKQTEFSIPFVFYDGSNTPGGVCRMKKGDFVWLFLDRARKMGADMASKAQTTDRTRKDWARIGVDDLMLVKGDLIIPHHFDFHYFIINKTVGYNEKPVFPLSSEPTEATPKELLNQPVSDEAATPEPKPSSDLASNLTTASDLKQQKATIAASTMPETELEGYTDDPRLTKVVDSRWYNRNKHIYPASIWENFDPARDYTKGPRVDQQGNAFFFSSR
ncbi:hypothetical protein MBLNU230_g1642t1 [Neophaeotheca triangularis]